MPDSKPAPKLSSIAATIARRVQLDDVRLIDSECAQHLRGNDEAPENVENAFNASGEIVVEPRHLIRIRTRFQVRARYPNAESEKPAVLVEAHFLLAYSIESIDDLSDEQLDAFAKMNGVYNAWPYWREFVQSMTQRMGLPPLVMPVMTGASLEAIYAKKAAKEADSDDESGDEEPAGK